MDSIREGITKVIINATYRDKLIQAGLENRGVTGDRKAFEQQDDEDYSSNASHRVSLNYLTNATIDSRRAGKKYKEARGRIVDGPGVLPLNGFVCEGYGMTRSSVYLDESFKVHQKGVTLP